MRIEGRALAGVVAAYPAVNGAVTLALSLPINRIDAMLTAASFVFVVFVGITTWIAGATKMLRLFAGIFVPGVLLTTLLVTIPRP
jgi:hypothetical protein